MSRPVEIQAMVAALPALYSPRNPQELIANITRGADHLLWLASHWSPETLSETCLDEAAAAVAGMRRLIGELRQHVNNDQEVRTDGSF